MPFKSRKQKLSQRNLVYGLCGIAALLVGIALITTNGAGTSQHNATGVISFNLGSLINTILNLTNLTRNSPTGPPGESFIRIRPLDNQGCSGCNGNAVWSLPNYYAENVLSLISYMKPNVLERYTSGPLNATMLVPTVPGDPVMNVAQFLNASVDACNCYLIPRINMSIGVANVLIQAKALRQFPVKTKMKYLSLDWWGAFARNNSAANVTTLFTQLYGQGWKGIGINGCGGEIANALTYPSFVDVCVTTSDWQPNQQQLKIAQSESNIKKIILYIDFPSEMQKFSELNTDQEANVMSNLASLQSADTYKLDYNLLQVLTFNSVLNGTIWDTSQRFTSANGIWHGESLTQVFKGLEKQYNS